MYRCLPSQCQGCTTHGSKVMVQIQHTGQQTSKKLNNFCVAKRDMNIHISLEWQISSRRVVVQLFSITWHCSKNYISVSIFCGQKNLRLYEYFFSDRTREEKAPQQESLRNWHFLPSAIPSREFLSSQHLSNNICLSSSLLKETSLTASIHE